MKVRKKILKTKMNNSIMAKEGESSWCRYIKKRIRNNLNFTAIFSGMPGIGKSYSALSIAYELDDKFDPREQVAFDFKTLMNAINKCNDPSSDLGKRKYRVILFDEAQEIGKRDWQSRINKLFNYLISTFRHQNIIVLFTSPYADFLDSASLKLFNSEISCLGWSKKTQKSQVRPKLLQWNPKKQKFYYHSLFVSQKGKKGYTKLRNWFVKRPPRHITEPYEQFKTAFTQALNLKITKELQAMDSEETKEESKGELNPESMQPDLFDEVQKGYINQEELRKRMERRLNKPVNISLLNRNLQSMRKKGYDDRKYKTSLP